MNKLVKILLGTFLVVCILVHVYGLRFHTLPESNLSHVIHLISYSLCLFTLLQPVKFRLSLYVLGAVYPFLYHADCFFTPLINQHKFSAICLLVIVVLPLAAWWVAKQNRPA